MPIRPWLQALEHSEKRFIVMIFCLGLMVRMLYNVFVTGLDSPPVGDAAAYDMLGANLATGRGFELDDGPTSVRAPLLPFLLGGIYALFGHSYAAARVVLTFIGTSTCILIYYLGKTLFSVPVARLAGVVSAFYPFLIAFSGSLLTETLVLPLILLSVLFLLRGANDNRSSYLILAGAAFGLACLSRPTALALPPFILLWFVIQSRFDLTASLKRFGIFLALAVIMIIPWTVRNYTVHNDFVPVVSGKGGFDLWKANNPVATGILYYDQQNVPEYRVRFASEAEMGRFYRQRALEYIKENPTRFARLAGTRLVEFWKVTSPRVPQSKNVVSMLSYGVVLLLALAGIIIAFKHRAEVMLPVLIITCFTLVHMVYPSIVRYRLPIEPFLIIFAAYAFIEGLNKFRRLSHAGPRD